MSANAGWRVLMVLIAAVLVAGSCIVYVAHQQRQADRRWCALLLTIDAPDAPPPTTPRGVQVQQEIRALRHSFGCKESS